MNQNESLILDNSDYQNSNPMNTINEERTEFSCTRINRSIGASIEELKPVVTEKYDLENPNKSKIIKTPLNFLH